MKKLALISILIIAVFVLGGCTQTGEQMICVPAKDISSICEQSGYDPFLDTLEDVENQLDAIEENETAQIIGDISGATSKLDNIEKQIIPDYTVMEGELLKISPQAKDPDGDPLIFTFTKPLNSKGEWQTKIGEAGVYYTNITASDGQNFATKTVIILVKRLENRPPTISDIKDMTVKEGDLVKVSPSVIDPEGKTVIVTLSDPIGNDGTWQTDYSSAGEYTITVTASDDKYKVTKTFLLTVKNQDRAPVIVNLTVQPVNEGELLKVNVNAIDADNDRLRILYGAPLNTAGEWQTQKGDVGNYTVNITVSDGELSYTTQATLIVKASNLPPTLENVNDITASETDMVVISPKVTDPEGDTVTVTISEPVGNDGTWQTDYSSAGVYEITITASDGRNTATKTIKLTVEETNRPPIFG